MDKIFKFDVRLYKLKRNPITMKIMVKRTDLLNKFREICLSNQTNISGHNLYSKNIS